MNRSSRKRYVELDIDEKIVRSDWQQSNEREEERETEMK
jgi:hypothetical protein